MCRLTLEARFVVTLTLWLLILLSSPAFAQVGQARTGDTRDDRFTSVHETLNGAADKTLAFALADKPWMNTLKEPTTSDRASSSIGADPVVRLRAAVDRVEQLRPTIEPILKKYGVPPELSAVVLVESGGLSSALSAKGARGIWQFMPATARRYGLVVDGFRDDRTDVKKATHASARYLSDLHTRFGDWSLALAAYNAGEPVVRAAMHHSGLRGLESTGFGSISDSPLLPQETRRYVPAVIAAMDRLQLNDTLGVRGKKVKLSHVVYASSGLGN